MKIPAGLFSAGLGQLFVQGVGRFPFHHGFCKHRKFHSESVVAKRRNFLVRLVFLVSEVAGWKANYAKTSGFELTVHFLQFFVLPREPAKTGGIHHKKYLTLEIAHR